MTCSDSEVKAVLHKWLTHDILRLWDELKIRAFCTYRFIKSASPRTSHNSHSISKLGVYVVRLYIRKTYLDDTSFCSGASIGTANICATLLIASRLADEWISSTSLPATNCPYAVACINLLKRYSPKHDLPIFIACTTYTYKNYGAIVTFSSLGWHHT